MTITPEIAYEAMTKAWHTGRAYSAYQLAGNLRKWIEANPRQSREYQGGRLMNIIAIEQAARTMVESEIEAGVVTCSTP